MIKQNNMIDDNRIQQVANQYAGHGPEVDEDIYVSAKREAFIEGIKWFKNALWHRASEEPDKYEKVILQFKEDLDEDNINFTYEMGKGCGYPFWNYEIEDDNFIKWCYIEDLLTKGGEE